MWSVVAITIRLNGHSYVAESTEHNWIGLFGSKSMRDGAKNQMIKSLIAGSQSDLRGGGTLPNCLKARF